MNTSKYITQIYTVGLMCIIFFSGSLGAMKSSWHMRMARFPKPLGWEQIMELSAKERAQKFTEISSSWSPKIQSVFWTIVSQKRGKWFFVRHKNYFAGEEEHHMCACFNSSLHIVSLQGEWRKAQLLLAGFLKYVSKKTLDNVLKLAREAGQEQIFESILESGLYDKRVEREAYCQHQELV